MSHLHEREEKVCLNCGTQLVGRYCQNCGQENVEPKESTWHLVVHFFNDVTHFDGKLFSTLKFLLLKPGFLTEEYVKGRRASYLNPIRMYLFISAVFFLVLTKFIVPVNHIHINEETKHTTDTTKKEPKHALAKQVKALSGLADSQVFNSHKLIPLKNGDTLTEIQITNYEPNSVKAYDSLQRLLPDSEKDDWLNRYMARKRIAINRYKENNEQTYVKDIVSRFFHSFPYLLFISLPLIALLLKLLYVRRKQYYFVSHGIFIIHYFCFLFIGFLFYYAAAKFVALRFILSYLVPIGLLIYLFAAMKRFYKQGVFKTFVKFFLLVTTSLVFLIVLMLVSLLVSYFETAG